MRARSWTLAIAAAAVMCAGGTAGARGHVFDYAVERFEADGNVHGLQDGIPDVVDEFDDGVLGLPEWGVGPGTAVESDGALHLKDPGFGITVLGLSPVSFEVSEVHKGDPAGFLQAGAGDLVLRSYWRPQPLGINHYLHMSLEWIGPDGWHFAGLVLTNYNQALGDLYNPPWPTGYVMTAHDAHMDVTGHLDRQDHQVIDPAAITGLLVFELRYDDTRREITVTYSLDGGATFAAPFAPIPVSLSQGTAGLYLGADPRDGACPGEFFPTLAVFSKLEPPAGDERFTLKGTAASGSNLVYGLDGLRLLVTDEGAGGAPVFDVTVPDGATAYQKACDPRDGYVPRGGRRRYVNYSDALPPDCIPGSAHGLRLLELGWNGTAKVKIKANGATVPSVVGPLRVGLYKPGGPTNECDGYVGQMTCVGNARKAKCK